jgi:hypothetical protein
VFAGTIVEKNRLHFPQNRVRPVLKLCARWARYDGRSDSRALRRDRPFCMSRFRNGPHSSSSSYGRRLNWPSKRKVFLFEILHHLHRLRNRLWWRAVERSGAEDCRRSGRKPTNQHAVKNYDEIQHSGNDASGRYHHSCYTICVSDE